MNYSPSIVQILPVLITDVGYRDKMFKKILVPYDTSKPSNSALKHAIELAKSNTADCEIVVAQVIPKIPATPILLERPVTTKKGETILLSDYVKQLCEQMQSQAEENLDKKRKEIMNKVADNTKVRTIVLVGDSISNEIIKLAEKERVELIVIGNVGLSGLSKLKTLGSVSRAVSERSPCPVMIVH